MAISSSSAKGLGERILAAVGFTAVAALIMILFNPWASGTALERGTDHLAKIGASLLLLAAALLTRRSPRLEKYWQLIFGLFTLTVVVSLEWIFGVYVVDYLRVTDATPAGWAFQKLNGAFIAISAIVACTFLSGGSLGSIYIQKGNLRLGLTIGIAVFLVFALGAFPMATLFEAQDLSLARVMPWTPWILLYVLANGAMEELMFRGLFLRKLVPIVGKHLAIFLLAFIFTGLHLFTTYSADQRIFISITFVLALALGYLMHHSDSAWGSILFHAGMDIPIMVGLFSQLG